MAKHGSSRSQIRGAGRRPTPDVKSNTFQAEILRTIKEAGGTLTNDTLGVAGAMFASRGQSVGKHPASIGAQILDLERKGFLTRTMRTIKGRGHRPVCVKVELREGVKVPDGRTTRQPLCDHEKHRAPGYHIPPTPITPEPDSTDDGTEISLEEVLASGKVTADSLANALLGQVLDLITGGVGNLLGSVDPDGVIRPRTTVGELREEIERQEEGRVFAEAKVRELTDLWETEKMSADIMVQDNKNLRAEVARLTDEMARAELGYADLKHRYDQVRLHVSTLEDDMAAAYEIMTEQQNQLVAGQGTLTDTMTEKLRALRFRVNVERKETPFEKG